MTGITGDLKSRGTPANPVLPGKWPLKQCVYIRRESKYYITQITAKMYLITTCEQIYIFMSHIPPLIKLL